MVEISLETVKQHNTPNDLWVVIENKVYDLTKFRSEHPGGDIALDEVAGCDATKDFIDVGHSQEAREIMKKYCIGDLAIKDRKSQLPLREVGAVIGSLLFDLAVSYLLMKAFTRK